MCINCFSVLCCVFALMALINYLDLDLERYVVKIIKNQPEKIIKKNNLNF